MINNVDEHPIPPIWRREKLIRLKTGVMQLLYSPLSVSDILRTQESV